MGGEVHRGTAKRNSHQSHNSKVHVSSLRTWADGYQRRTERRQLKRATLHPEPQANCCGTATAT